jgi:mono/diheme cytochrome c family protein
MNHRVLLRMFGVSLLTLGAILTSGLSQPVHGQVTAQQRRELSSIRSTLRRAALLQEQGKSDAAAKMTREAQQRLVALLTDGNQDLVQQAKTTYEVLTRLRGELQFEGISLPPLAPLDEMGGGLDGGISFVQQVAPMLVGKCGRCHIQRSQGQFSMTSFEALSKGTPAGVVLFPKDPDGSRLMEVIESGDMPRGGTKLTEQEIETLKNWIREGARFDGEDPTANLATLGGSQKPAEQADLTVMSSKGTEKVQFSRDVAPVLAEICANCHGNGQQVRGRFNLTTFRTMVRGGDSGVPWVPGKSADSLLLKKLEGTADGQRMPVGRPPLSDEQTKMFATWIDEGASYDGGDVNQNVAEVAAVAKARLAAHEELSADRARIANRNWKLVMPRAEPDQLESEDFLLLGNVGDSYLQEYGKVAESVVPRVSKLFRVSSGSPLIKGRMTLYFFKRKYDYGEFGQMVEQRSLPNSWRSHWRYSTVDAYGVTCPVVDDGDALEAMLTEQIAGVYIASCGNSPAWFSHGIARAATAKLYPGDERVRSWIAQLPEVKAHLKKPDDFLTGNLGPEETAVAEYSFAEMLMGDSRRFMRLLGSLRDGTSFEEAFRQAYGDAPAKIAEIWAKQSSRRRR